MFRSKKRIALQVLEQAYEAAKQEAGEGVQLYSAVPPLKYRYRKVLVEVIELNPGDFRALWAASGGGWCYGSRSLGITRKQFEVFRAWLSARDSSWLGLTGSGRGPRPFAA